MVEDNKMIQVVAHVSAAIRQAVESDTNPGNTVHGTQNPGQIHLQGLFDVAKIAKSAIVAYAAWIENEAKLVAAAAKADAGKVEQFVVQEAEAVVTEAKKVETAVATAVKAAVVKVLE